MCQPQPTCGAMQFGWSGETVRGFLGRMGNDFAPLQADRRDHLLRHERRRLLADERRARRRSTATRMTGIVETLKKAGVRFIVVGSPGRGRHRHLPRRRTRQGRAAMYNKTLADAPRHRQRGRRRSRASPSPTSTTPMIDVMAKAKAKYGNDYHVGGGDGVHPDANGHLVMAYAFLKGLGCDGNIGTITVDLAANKADATDGHKVARRQRRRGRDREHAATRSASTATPSRPNATKRHHRVPPVQPGPEPLHAGRQERQARTSCKVTWGDATRSSPRDQTGEGHQPRGRVPATTRSASRSRRSKARSASSRTTRRRW